jgi:CheY-like chemotaxis protein
MGTTAPLVSDRDCYSLTRRGEAELRGAQTSVSSIVLELLLRIDGRKRVAEIKAGMPSVNARDLEEALKKLLSDGLIAYAKPAQSDELDFFSGGGFGKSAPAAPALCAAENEASEGVKCLEEQGYYVCIARKPTTCPTLPADRKPKLVIVEDEPLLGKFLMHLMTFEGFEARVAADRQAIVQALREPPRPDLVLMDVNLPDANGFDVLSRMRQHEALRGVPVMMLTTQNTRESIIRGITLGANGYITKPFQPEVLLKAVRTLFGLETAAA